MAYVNIRFRTTKEKAQKIVDHINGPLESPYGLNQSVITKFRGPSGTIVTDIMLDGKITAAPYGIKAWKEDE